MRYRVGDKVRIRTDLRVNIKYGNYDYIYEMEKYKGKTAYITEIYRSKFDDLLSYCLDIDNGEWGWTDDMLEPATIENTYEDRNMKYILDGDKTIVIQYYTDEQGIKRYRKGVTKKFYKDEYNEAYGVIYAVADAYGIDKNKIHIGKCKCNKNINNKEIDFINKFREEQIAINVQSKEEAKDFVELLNKNNIIRRESMNDLIKAYDIYKCNTTYTYNFLFFDVAGYGSVDFHKKQGWTIIPYKKIFKEAVSLKNIPTEKLLIEIKKRLKN